MRIIGGEYGGRRFNPPHNMPFTRPTTDIAKEGLFNMLYHALDFGEMKTLDLFGGTGSISYELASRGVPELTIVEKDPVMHAFIKKTAASLGIERISVIKMDVFKFIAQCNEQYDFIFAGPPYALSAIDDLPRQLFDKRLLKNNGWFVLEHTPRNDYKSFPFYRTEKKYGTTIFSVFVENRGS
jgi:16S rRNA (guanine(966)-N(2))-methyltransferase RsmD